VSEQCPRRQAHALPPCWHTTEFVHVVPQAPQLAESVMKSLHVSLHGLSLEDPHSKVSVKFCEVVCPLLSKKRAVTTRGSDPPAGKSIAFAW